jgi:hypothetical protein
LDELAQVFFPDNQNHRRAFVHIWLEIKYARDQFLASTKMQQSREEITDRTIEIVRSKMKKMGLIKRISHFNPAHGHQSGWAFSSKFRSSLKALGDTVHQATQVPESPTNRQKDHDSIHYI